MAEKKTEKLNIPLGSGFPFIMEFDDKMPTIKEIEQEENRLGYIKQGCNVEYTPTSEALKDDMGMVSRTYISEEEAVMKMALIAWNYSVLDKLIATARITEGVDGVRTIKIGGVQNDDGKRYLIHFYHPDKQMGDLRVTIVGNNTAGLTLSYVPDDATMIEPEFTALPCDKEGTLIILSETPPNWTGDFTPGEPSKEDENGEGTENEDGEDFE